MKKTQLFSVLAAGTVLLGISHPAWALFGDDEARKAILDLRERMEVVQNGQMLLQGQIDQLREQNAQLIGRIEQLTNDLVV
ncbi:MAG: tol-pal system protein YbgF, partial [Sutterellaceae bacterium]|nr:tol-pal system protein YbgF [Sutterellaceae bacterium]